MADCHKAKHDNKSAAIQKEHLRETILVNATTDAVVTRLQNANGHQQVNDPTTEQPVQAPVADPASNVPVEPKETTTNEGKDVISLLDDSSENNSDTSAAQADSQPSPRNTQQANVFSVCPILKPAPPSSVLDITLDDNYKFDDLTEFMKYQDDNPCPRRISFASSACDTSRDFQQPFDHTHYWKSAPSNINSIEATTGQWSNTRLLSPSPVHVFPFEKTKHEQEHVQSLLLSNDSDSDDEDVLTHKVFNSIPPLISLRPPHNVTSADAIWEYIDDPFYDPVFNHMEANLRDYHDPMFNYLNDTMFDSDFSDIEDEDEANLNEQLTTRRTTVASSYQNKENKNESKQNSFETIPDKDDSRDTLVEVPVLQDKTAVSRTFKEGPTQHEENQDDQEPSVRVHAVYARVYKTSPNRNPSVIAVTERHPYLTLPLGTNEDNPPNLQGMLDTGAGLNIGYKPYWESFASRYPQYVKAAGPIDPNLYDSISVGGCNKDAKNAECTHFIELFMPIRENGRQVTLRIALADDFAANLILGIPFFVRARMIIYLAEGCAFSQSFQRAFPIQFLPPIRRDTVPIQEEGGITQTFVCRKSN
jgi:hypothetical protein